MNYNWQSDTLRLAREALKAQIIKAALDGKPNVKLHLEAALKDVNSAILGQLPDKPGTIPCHMTLVELLDIQTATKQVVDRFKDGNASAVNIAARMLRLYERVTATINMNSPR